MKLFFKFKIAIISFAISGALLTAFGVAFFAFIYSSGLDRMDRELRSLVEAPLRGDHLPNYWENLGKSLFFIYEGREEQIALLVLDPNGHALYQSDNAPPVLTSLQRPKLPSPPPLRSGNNQAVHFVERLDRNKDQQVSSEEFDGPPHMFGRHDLNNDGYISISEAGKLEHPPRGLRRERRPGTPPDGLRQGPPVPTASRFQSIHSKGINWRAGIFANPDTIIIAAMDMDSFNAEIHRFRNAFMISVPIGLLLLGFTGWFLAGRAMKPVAIIANTAEGITAQGLGQRIPNVGNDIELERLVTVSNNMLDRLEKSYHQAVRFSADAAHELQTPLTILQGELDNAIQTAEDGSTEQQRYSMLLDELRNLKAVVQKLLLLAHADEGRLNINPVPVNLSELIGNAAEDIEIMAPELEVECHIADGITVSADTALLNQAIRNMTSNAAKYATEDGQAIFTLLQKKQAVCFTLANTAEPIPDEDCALLFERFHRVEKSRTAAGSGLGLSLAREIARAHGGELTLDPYENGMVSFTLSLPVS
jgi:signal transduction histidine kinase